MAEKPFVPAHLAPPAGLRHDGGAGRPEGSNDATTSIADAVRSAGPPAPPYAPQYDGKISR